MSGVATPLKASRARHRHSKSANNPNSTQRSNPQPPPVWQDAVVSDQGFFDANGTYRQDAALEDAYSNAHSTPKPKKKIRGCAASVHHTRLLHSNCLCSLAGGLRYKMAGSTVRSGEIRLRCPSVSLLYILWIQRSIPSISTEMTAAVACKMPNSRWSIHQHPELRQ